MPESSAIRAWIDSHRGRRQSNKVLHGHPSPMFWLDRDIPICDVMANRRAAAETMRKKINLYVGTPYCLPTQPDRCGFCLFPSEVYRNRQQLDTYLDYLRREGELFHPWLGGAELASIYFGGGTSNLYRADQYAPLMGIVRELFDIPPDIEVTLEGIPQTFSREKLEAMQAAGINRISMGVQQLDDELIAASGRRQTAAQVFDTIDDCRDLGLPLSIDLIFGWPNQTVDHMLNDLRALVAGGITHITNYELNVAGRTDFSRNRRHELPTTEQNLEMYRIGRDYLVAEGFRQTTPYDFERAGPVPSAYLYEELFRQPFRMGDGNVYADANGHGNGHGNGAHRGQGNGAGHGARNRNGGGDHGETLVGYDAWGWGFAGISFFFGAPDSPGWAYMNHVRVDDYFRDLDAGRFPVMRGFHYTPEDLHLHLLFQEMQGLEVDGDRFRALTGRDVVADYRAIWRELAELDWVRVDDQQIRILGDGAFYLPLIQNLMARDRLEEMRRERVAGVAGASAFSAA